MSKPQNGDVRRERPIKIEWAGMIGRLTIDGEAWGAVEWSEKRKAWCIEDAEGRCLSHHSNIHGEDKDKRGAVALAEAMIKDGRLPSPEAAREARKERLRRDRERRAKQPSEIRRREQREEKRRRLDASFKADWEDRKAESAEPLYEALADVLDFADPDLWKSNSFARLRARLIIHMRAVIAGLETERPLHLGADRKQRLARAKEILSLLLPDDL